MKKKFLLVFMVFGSIQFGLSQTITPNTQSTPYSTTQTLRTMPSAYDSGIQYNFVRTYTPSRPLRYGTEVMETSRTITEVKTSTQYIDGLGRVFQTVDKNISPAGYDRVTPVEYDSMERITYQYLPYVSTDTSGMLKMNPFNDQQTYCNGFYNPTNNPAGEHFFYGKTTYDDYPGGPVIKSTAPGNSWTGNARGITASYEANGDSEVRIWTIDTAIESIPVSTSWYKKDQLHRNVTTDEQGHMIVEYVDKQGNIILKKVQMTSTDTTSHTNWLCTYYVYDDLNNLRFVIPPKAVAYIAQNNWNLTSDPSLPDNLCFRYDYDQRGRLIIKKVPGAGRVEMVYDAWDRLVMMQDSNLVNKGQWMVTQYDVFNRPVKTYLWTNSQSRDTHAALATDTVAYPTLSGTYVMLTQTFYDNYSWVSGSGSGLSTTLNTSETSTGFLPPSSTVAPYPDPFSPILGNSGNSDTVKGLVTGTQTLIMGTSNYLYSLNLFDEFGRIVQTESTNNAGGTDYLTTQYSFDNRVLETKLHQTFTGLKPDSITTLTKYLYDNDGRLVETTKTLDNLPEVIQARNTYNQLGQLQQKKLGQQLNGNTYSLNPMDSLNYDYNVRGWLTGINKSYATATTNGNYFGMQLSYDFGFNVPNNGYYNGNIAGIVWRSKGDGEQRAYGFLYDTVNRILKADFTQNDGGWNTSAGLDFSAKMGDGSNPNSAYDPNGNILFMSQTGWKITGSSLIDSLTYNYNTNSNQLKNVIDGDNDPNTKLGDFRTSSLDTARKDTSTVDYNYDGNGNLIRDMNKDIDTTGANPITYDYLNLPDTIRVKTRGQVIYTYDAAGRKLAKTVRQPGLPDAVTQYLEGSVYQNDTLQFVSTEEGRIRYTKKYFTSGDSAYMYYYDYFIRDHLGNTRTILTEQVDTAQYMATMEAAYRAKELQLFYNIDSTSYAVSAIPGTYPPDHTTTPNDSVARVNGSLHEVGPAILLKVMSGDSVKLGVEYFFHSGGTVGSPNSSIQDVLNSLAAGLVIMTGGGHGGIPDLNNTSTSPVYAALTSFENNDTNTVSTPKAYFNWMLLDDQYHYVGTLGQSGAFPVVTPETIIHLATSLQVQKSGFLYIWVSNETPGWDVFFDNLSVTTTNGPLVEENHYYPFGLTMAGISDKALKSNYAQNKFRFNGKELQNQEFSDGTGLEEYDFGRRHFDEQIGRWHSVDPLADKYDMWSPYNFTVNNPERLIDPDGTRTESTHTDSTGRVIAVFDDGDLNIYKHNSDSAGATEEVAENHTPSNTSAGGTVVGTTLAINSFRRGAKIDFGSYRGLVWLSRSMNDFKEILKAMNGDGFAAILTYAANAGNNDYFDYKSKDGGNVLRGSQISPGVYLSARDFGNFFAGLAARLSGMDKKYFLKVAGAFNLSGNDKFTWWRYLNSNRNVFPNYGEDHISNQFQRLGYEKIISAQDEKNNYYQIFFSDCSYCVPPKK